MSSCCHKNPEPPESAAKSCCGGTPAAKPDCHPDHAHGHGTPAADCCGSKKRTDWLLWGSLMLIIAGVAGHFIGGGPAWWHKFAHACFEFVGKAWWGILTGIIAVGVIGRIPRELISGLLGKGGSFSGILRAVFAGTLLDLCNHGVLMIGSQLYRKGASLGQTMAFLISSPWNSLSVTLILAALIGWKWMLFFIALSMVIGVATGFIADLLVKRGALPANPNAHELPENFRFGLAFREAGRAIKPTPSNVKGMVIDGFRDSAMIVRWIFFGIALAGAIRAFVPDAMFSQYFGPSLVGLFLTLAATTIIEVCSEGSSPIAADLLTRAAAPGNAFTFLMAGAATDYTEMLVLRETTKSWKAALALPLIATPQILLIGWLINRLTV
jgi:uncharacterized membrane protein YraQ (UPF0718 family)